MSRRKIKSQLQQYSRNKRPVPGLLGDYSRNVEVPGRANYVYVRLVGGLLTQAFNNRVPNKYDRRVLVGYDPAQPHLLQVLGLQSDIKVYGETAKIESQQMLHHASHEWNNSDGGNDVVFVELRQFMPARPMPLYVSGTSVFVNRAVGWIGSQWQQFTGSAFNIGGYIPSTGASFGLLYIDTNGLLNFSGGVRKDLNSLRISDIPSPVPGTLPIAAVRLWSGQTGIAEALTDTDIVDLRFPLAHDHKFRELSDVPRSYTGSASKYPRVNAGETGLEFVSITGGTSGFGHIIQDEGTPLTQRGAINFVGAGVAAVDDSANSRTTIRIPGTLSFYESGTFKVSGTAVAFNGSTVWVTSTGSTAYVSISGSSSGGGHTIQDDGVPLTQRTNLNFVGAGFATGDNGSDTTIISGTAQNITVRDDGAIKHTAITEIDFGGGLNVSVTGSTAYIDLFATGSSTYMRAGSPSALSGLTGTYWKVPGDLYASGTLSIFINGVAQNPVTNYTEQYSMSGTFALADMPPTGSVHTAIWGVPTSVFSSSVSVAASYIKTGAQNISNGTGTIVNFDTVVVDTHSFVTTGASWKFQPSIAGNYAVSAGILFAQTNTWALGETGQLSVHKNGGAVQVCYLARKDNYSNTNMYMQLSGGAFIVPLNGSTDYIDIRVKQGSGGTLALYVAEEEFCWVSIYRVA